MDRTQPHESLSRLVAARQLRDLARSLSETNLASASGLWGSSIAAVTAALEAELSRPVLVICGHVDEADDIADDMELFHGRRPDVLPALELGGSLGKVSEEQVSNRLQLVARLAGGKGQQAAGGAKQAAGSGQQAERGAKQAAGSRQQAARKESEATSLPALLVAPIQSIMQPVPSAEQLTHLMRTLRPGMKLEPEKLIVWLADHGYNRLDQVEVPGDFAVRGGIIDIYLPGQYESAGEMMGLTARLDFFDDELESIKQFDLDTLGSTGVMDEVTLVDLKGAMPDTGESTHLLTHLPDDTIVVLWAPLEIAEQSKSYLMRLPEEIKGIYPLGAVLKNAERFTRLELSQFDQGTMATQTLVGKEAPHVKLPIRSLQRFETEVKKAMGELAELAEDHEVVVFCENEGERKRLGEILDADRPGLRERIGIPVGYLHRGFVWEGGEEAGSGQRAAGSEEAGEEAGGGRRAAGSEEAGEEAGSGQRAVGSEEAGEEAGGGQRAAGSASDHSAASRLLPAVRPLPIALLGHHELFHRYEQRRTAQKVTASRPVDSFLDLKDGDYVVHVAHGIARFMGMQTINKDGKNEEYLSLRFADNATLHVPAARINLVQKYMGGLTGHPQLSRLGSGVWEKQKAKVAEAVMDLAAELIEVQAARNAEIGQPYPPDTEWQKEFEEEFPYDPTPDQLTSADEIKQDMQKTRPMDRLLCGDVGYGKTELAMRAAFKAAEFGKQVAILVPTTVLAEQHYRSFKERMASYPFCVESISRFKTGRESKNILARASRGEVDVLIGTHRLLSKDVKFKDLGLVVIDEEQRFGVTHKERLKQMRKMVDVLTMSATPIPRTLHLSMMGLRDISSLTTAPQNRRSIVTEVMPFDRERIKQAMLRELNRDGQIYFVHNRVHNITEMADDIQKLVPDARILIGHGQMEQGALEEVMVKFVRHEADILVCTTIIESGLDIPNVNTMIINQADRFGLSELHQLRGRVGRWKHRAYCYLLLPPDRPVTPVATKRLKAIEEYSHLGAGFKIAMRDLELRGAGNILGPEQSGHIATVGYEMYCQLLDEATRELKHEKRQASPEAHVDIGISAFIPKTYIPADRQRMDVYRRLTRCGSMEMLEALTGDITDAFGEIPRQVMVLITLTELRLLAGLYGIESMIKKEQDVVLTVHDAARAQQALTGAPGTLRVIDQKTVYLRMPATFMESDTLLMVLRNLLRKAYDRDRGAVVTPEKLPVATRKLVNA